MTNILFDDDNVVMLNGIELPHLVMEPDIFITIAATVDRTIQGKVLVTEQIIQGQIFDLVGGDNWGWMNRTTMLELIDILNVVNQTYTLDYNSTQYNVRFRYEDGAPIEATPILGRPNLDSTITDDEGNTVVTPDDYWYNNIRIKLMKL